MKSIFIEEFGENLEKQFREKLIEVEKIISNYFGELECIDTRFSPEIGASIHGKDFVVEIRSWSYLKNGKEVCKLVSMLDKRGQYLYIKTEPICIN